MIYTTGYLEVYLVIDSEGKYNPNTDQKQFIFTYYEDKYEALNHCDALNKGLSTRRYFVDCINLELYAREYHIVENASILNEG